MRTGNSKTLFPWAHTGGHSKNRESCTPFSMAGITLKMNIIQRVVRPSALPRMGVAQFRTTSVAASELYTERQAKLNRPVSPHVTIYAFPIVSISSITNRVTGVMLSSKCQACAFFVYHWFHKTLQKRNTDVAFFGLALPGTLQSNLLFCPSASLYWCSNYIIKSLKCK